MCYNRTMKIWPVPDRLFRYLILPDLTTYLISEVFP